MSNDIRKHLMGIETEFGLSVRWADGTTHGRSRAIGHMLGLLRNSYPHLSGGASRCGDVFLPCGRIYGDVGRHPEHCTPECDNPWDVVRYTLAGRQVMNDLRRQMAMEGIEATLLTSNVDYVNSTTWGCHESYMFRGQVATVRAQIIPHLASRLIYTGAGGFDSHSPGLKFMLSPRVAHLVTDISSESTSNRAIVHAKDEPLCRGQYHRLHLICGESLQGQLGSWLKVGVTSLVVTLIDNGVGVSKKVKLLHPLAAMRTFADDPFCRRRVEVVGGRRMTALEIQWYHLEQVEAHLGDRFMPPWAGEVCRRWREILERLDAGGPEALATVTDWGIKLAIYRDFIKNSGRISLRELACWNHVLARLAEALHDSPMPSISVEQVLEADSPAAPTVLQLTPFLDAHGLTWDGLRPVVDLRTQLYSLDTRFGMLGEEGIFNRLDADGVLDHHVDGVDNIDHAVHHPPIGGRAQVRGECIRRLSDQRDRYLCTWHTIVDTKSPMRLDLSDPFVSSEHWVDASAERHEDQRSGEVA